MNLSESSAFVSRQIHHAIGQYHIGLFVLQWQTLKITFVKFQIFIAESLLDSSGPLPCQCQHVIEHIDAGSQTLWTNLPSSDETFNSAAATKVDHPFARL